MRRVWAVVMALLLLLVSAAAPGLAGGAAAAARGVLRDKVIATRSPETVDLPLTFNADTEPETQSW